jgi:hypothetical protein
VIRLLTVLALFGSALSQLHDDPCESGATAPQQFRQDYASCEAYFWCDGLRAIPSGPCNTGFIFDENAGTAGACVAEPAAAPFCDPCPATGLMAVAVASDTTCLTYHICYEGEIQGDPTPEVLTCGTGAVFDRADGSCVPFSANLCPGSSGGGGGTPACGTTVNGNVAVPDTCDQFITCVAGAQVGQIRECSNDWHFNPAIQNCDLPANRVPLCTAAANKRYVPSAPEITRTPTFRERFAKKLHM